MVKHTQTIHRLLLTNCLSVFDHFVGLVLKGLGKLSLKQKTYERLLCISKMMLILQECEVLLSTFAIFF